MGQPILSNSERLSKEMTSFAQELQKPYFQGQNASLRDWVKKKNKIPREETTEAPMKYSVMFGSLLISSI